jgi:crotonobetainyl-CoA:carnitine CoA-transferase CaiB-like acyl-CoA transferase
VANAGKMGVALNLSKPEAREVVKDLARWADLVTESFTPGTMASLGLGYEQLSAINPSLVMLSSCVMGQTGPMAGFAGFGNLAAAVAGFFDITGWPDRAPAGPYLAYTDYTSAHLMVVTAMAALLHRRQTGTGQFVELSQSETALQFIAPALVASAATGTVFTRMGNDDLAMAPHGVYPAAGDDRWLALACPDDDRWPALCRLIDRPDLAADARLGTVAGRLRQRRLLDEAVSAWTSGRSPEEAAEACQAAGVAAYTVQTSADCLADPQLAHRGHVIELDHPQRRSFVEATRARLSRTPGRPQGHAPLLGEHTFEVLSDVLGYDEDRIADLAAAEVLE